MNFDFSDDLKLLKDEARKFLDDKSSPEVVRRVLEGPDGYDKALWSEMAAMGWTGASIPEELGGAGMGALGLCVLAEELGRSLAPVPFASTMYFAAEALMAGGSDAQKKAWLPRIAKGECIGTFALAEGPGKATPKRVRTTFRNGVLNGEKLPVPDGAAANLAIGAAILCASLVARSLDEGLCASLPLGTHWLWHVLNATMLAWMIETWRRHVAYSATS